VIYNTCCFRLSPFRILLAQGKANVNQMWGLVVLLVSKLAGYPVEAAWQETEFDKDTGILKSQRTLAEAVEITSSANEIHRDGILNMQPYQVNGVPTQDGDSLLVFGNKVSIFDNPTLPSPYSIFCASYLCSFARSQIAILGADILLGYASIQFSKLR
jgi:hypothetical protein